MRGEHEVEAQRGAGCSYFFLPAPIQSPDRDRMLRACFNDIVERDMRERVAARHGQPLRQLVQMLFESAGSELSVRRAAPSIPGGGSRGRRCRALRARGA